MSRFTEDQVQEFHETFSLFDNRGDGKIQLPQLGDVLRSMGQNPTEAEVKKCSYQYQSDPDARISFEQFLPIFTTISKNKDRSSVEDFVEGFRVFDKEQNGHMSSAELRHLLMSLGEKLNDEEVEQLLQNQEDQQGNVNYEEFVKMVMSG